MGQSVQSLNATRSAAFPVRKLCSLLAAPLSSAPLRSASVARCGCPKPACLPACLPASLPLMLRVYRRVWP